MIRHVVMFRWRDGITSGDIRAITEGLATLPGLIPEIRRYEFGTDLGLRSGSWDFALVADFDDEAGFRTYSSQPDHVALIDEHIAPNVAQAVRVQYEV